MSEEIIKTKICKICGKEKPANEFNSKGKGFYDTKCKVCNWFSKRNFDYNKTKWTHKEDRVIIDSLFNKKLSLNEISKILNKDIKLLCEHIVKTLKIGGQIKLMLFVECGNCGKIIKAKPSEFIKYDNMFCNKECHDEYQRNNPYVTSTILNKICPYCGKHFQVTKHKKKQKYCSKKCANKAKENKIIIQCKICGKNIIVKRSMADKTVTCSEECASENRRRICEEKSIKHTVHKICEYCNKKYKIVLSEATNSRFCSKKCHNNWMSENLVGENNPRFSSKLIKCDNCGKKHYQKPYKLKIQNYFFCSAGCRQEWYANVYSQTKEYKKFHRKKVVKMLSDGVFNHTNTQPQIILNNILNKLYIKHINEYNCKYVSMDNYLLEYQLMIECMGTFWHTDNRFYNKINYAQQRRVIRQDKSKNSYIKSQYGINILYLWEHDIINNPTLCKQLILKYINNRGVLENYHSFNYAITNYGLILKDNLIKPYMEWESEKLNKIVTDKVKKEMSRKQHNKWITFNCEYCGKEKEQLKSRYRKAKNHFCSWECHHAFRRKENKVLEFV